MEFKEEYNFVMNCSVPPRKLRIKKKCGYCEYLAGFPYVHCTLDCEIINKTIGEHTFESIPKDQYKCKLLRQTNEKSKCYKKRNRTNRN